jgi:hypothetical protein
MSAFQLSTARLQRAAYALTLLTAGLFLTGCNHKEGDGHDHGKEEAGGKEHGHDHGAESPSGASFKAGKGVSVTDETKKILGLKVADVTEEKLPHELRFTAQVYDTLPNRLTPVTNRPTPDAAGLGVCCTRTGRVGSHGHDRALQRPVGSHGGRHGERSPFGARLG